MNYKINLMALVAFLSCALGNASQSAKMKMATELSVSENIMLDRAQKAAQEVEQAARAAKILNTVLSVTRSGVGVDPARANLELSPNSAFKPCKKHA